MKINENIIKKYNKLYIEVAEYYNLGKKVRIGHSQLNFILIEDFGYSGKLTNNVDTILVHIQKNFTYFAPFYKFFHHENFCPGTSPKTLLNNMNKVIKKIRKENLDTGIKVT